MSLATSHSRRRTKLHTRVVGSPSGTPIKVACSVLKTVGGSARRLVHVERASEATNSLSVCSDRRREALPLLRAAVVGIHDLQGLCDSSPHLPVINAYAALLWWPITLFFRTVKPLFVPAGFTA